MYKLTKQLFIKKFKEKFGNDRVGHNFVRIYLANVDEQYALFVNGAILSTISYGTRYLC